MTSLEDIGFRSFVARDVVGAVAVSSSEMWVGGVLALGALGAFVMSRPTRDELAARAAWSRSRPASRVRQSFYLVDSSFGDPGVPVMRTFATPQGFRVVGQGPDAAGAEEQARRLYHEVRHLPPLKDLVEIAMVERKGVPHYGFFLLNHPAVLGRTLDEALAKLEEERASDASEWKRSAMQRFRRKK